MIVRVGFVVLAVSGGFGLLAYAVLWVVMPDEQGRRAAPPAPAVSARSQRVLAFVLILFGGLLLVRETGLWFGDRIVWPMFLAAIGLALAWPEGGARSTSVSASRMSVVRIGLGIAGVSAGAAWFAFTRTDFQAVGDALLAVFVTVAGLLLIFGPWWWRLGRELFEERRRRIRMEERTDMATRIHDSVLQTLALIQQNADDATETARLARRQERELRSWLFEDTVAAPGSLKAAVTAAAAEVEDLFRIAVDVVTVGDCPADEATDALVAAAKEALVNAAKFSGVESVSLYVEVESEAVTAFVRDRGAGFDPAGVPSDRKGIAESIRGRMERQGGRASIRSGQGEGTEVELVLPRRGR